MTPAVGNQINPPRALKEKPRPMTPSRFNAVIKAVRTAVQVLASAGFLAAVNAAVNGSGRYLPGNAKAAVLAATVPVVALAHNAMEDKGWIGTWLRRPTLTPAAAAKKAQKVSDAAAREAAWVAAQVTQTAPLAAPIVAQFEARFAELEQTLLARVGEIAAQLPQAAPAPGDAPTGGSTAVPATTGQ